MGTRYKVHSESRKLINIALSHAIVLVCQFFFNLPLISGLPAVREKSGKIFIFQGQGKVREFCKKSGKNFGHEKVREKSGNFVMNVAILFLITVLQLYVPYVNASYGPRWTILASFLWNVIFPPLKRFLGRKHVCWTQFIDLLSLRHDL